MKFQVLLLICFGFNAQFLRAMENVDRRAFLKSGQSNVNLSELIKSYESSPQERTKVNRQLGIAANACRTKVTRSLDELDALSAVERRLVVKSAKLRLSFLIEKLKKSEKPRIIAPTDLTFLSEVEDCTPLTEELVTLSQLSANWDLQDPTDLIEE
jgi:hypothetical protein